jgi:hypothetical protein
LKNKSSEISEAISANRVRNFSGGLNPDGIIIKPNPGYSGIAKQRGIISNGANLDNLIYPNEKTTRSTRP